MLCKSNIKFQNYLSFQTRARMQFPPKLIIHINVLSPVFLFGFFLWMEVYLQRRRCWSRKEWPNTSVQWTFPRVSHRWSQRFSSILKRTSFFRRVDSIRKSQRPSSSLSNESGGRCMEESHFLTRSRSLSMIFCTVWMQPYVKWQARCSQILILFLWTKIHKIRSGVDFEQSPPPR